MRITGDRRTRWSRASCRQELSPISYRLEVGIRTERSRNANAWRAWFFAPRPEGVDLDALKQYFTAVPANESAEMGATAALCEAAWDTLPGARQAVANAGTVLTDASSNRGRAVNVLRKKGARPDFGTRGDHRGRRLAL